MAELQRVLRLSMPMDAQAGHRSAAGAGGTASQVALVDAAPRAEVAAVSRGVADARGRGAWSWLRSTGAPRVLVCGAGGGVGVSTVTAALVGAVATAGTAR